MQVKIKKDYSTFLLTEFVAFIQEKYKIESTFKIIDSKSSWEIYKPYFNLQIYTPEEATKYNTIYVLNCCYLKITRKLYKN
jgi:hypothetical protein